MRFSGAFHAQASRRQGEQRAQRPQAHPHHISIVEASKSSWFLVRLRLLKLVAGGCALLLAPILKPQNTCLGSAYGLCGICMCVTSEKQFVEKTISV